MPFAPKLMWERAKEGCRERTDCPHQPLPAMLGKNVTFAFQSYYVTIRGCQITADIPTVAYPTLVDGRGMLTCQPARD